MTLSNAGMQGLRPGVCTSTTRPTTPYTGQIIYETDTGFLRVWDGANWDYLSQKRDATQFPRGVVGYAQRTSSFAVNTTLSDVTGLSTTFTAEAGRLYKVTYSIPSAILQTNAPSRLTIQTTDASNAILDQAYWYFTSVNLDIAWTRQTIHGFSSGSQTIKLRTLFDIGSGTGQLYSDAQRKANLVVEDIGLS